MGKKNKKKYYQQANDSSSVASTNNSGVSKSNNMQTSNDKQASVYNAHNEEYAMVRHDLIRVAIVNGLFLAAVLALYFVNKNNPFLEAWYQKLF